MATLHNIGELLRSGVRPTDEETEHLRELGGFVAEMYGRFMGGHAEHLASPSDLWSGRLSKRLSATTGARWEHGIGLAEMLLGSELTSFWQVASQGFSEGYGDFGGEMPMLALYEDEAPAAIEAAVDSAPARRRPSLFGSRQPAGARGRLNPAKLAKLAGRSGDGAVPGASLKAADGARWRDGSLAEMTVIKALSEGGLYLGDQLSAPVASLEFARRREAASVQRSGSVRPDASDVARAAGGAAAQRSNERGVVLDGVRIDGRTPALAAALSRADAVFGRGASAASERAAISESRMASLTASPSVSLDRGLGMGERPVYGFYDAVETSFLRLQDESTPAVAASVGGVVAPKGRRAGRVVQSSMPPSASGRARALEARSTAPGFPGASSATERQAQVARRATGAASQAPAMSLDHVVANAAGLRPFVGGVFSSPEASLGTSERLLATAGPRAHGVLFASDVAHDRAGQAIPKVQRGSMFAPRSMLVEGHVASRNALGGAGGAGLSTDAFLDRVAQVRTSQSGVDAYVGASTLASSDGARDGRPGQVAAAAGQMGVWASPPSNGSGPVPDGVTTRGAFGGAGAAPLGFAADSSFAMAGVGASAASWRLAVDGGPDLPLGATFSRHEAFAGERLNPEAQVSEGGAAAFRSLVAGGESRPSELAQALDGMVWVTLPQDGGGAPTVGEGLPLAALPRGRRAAMVPASLAFRAMKGSSQRAGEIAALRSGGSVAGPESVPAARTVGAQAVPGVVGATAAAGAQASAFASRTSAFEGRVLAALRSGRLESIAAADGAEHATSSRFLSSLVRDAASVSAVSSPVLAADAVRGTSVGALALAGDRRMTTGGGAIGGVERAAMVEQQQSMRAARFLERAVAQDGYGRIESERELIRQIAERELGSSDVATASTGGAASRRARGAVRSASSARGGDAVRGADAARGADSMSVASAGLSRLTEAKAALLRPVPTAREARAIADAFGPSGFVATQAKSSSALSFGRAGSDEPVLARLLASRGAQRGEVTVGERWELGGAFGERIASLSPERQREVARTFRAAGWGEQELEMLRIERSPGIDAAQPSAGADAQGGRRSAAARRAQVGTGQATVAGGLTQAAVATGSNFEQLGGPAAFVDAPSREGGKLAARIERLGRNMSRVALGAEALSGSVVEREAGVASMSAAKGVASTWLPLLGASGGATASYFGGLAPGVRAGSSGGGFASMREAIGDLVAIAEAGASNSDSPVGLSARREVLRRAIVAAERGFGGTVEARPGSGREPSMMAVARRGDE
ncbi:MAG: hypothetical protein JNJ59_00685, partial [Deltaproteobacteria bacterium]|nr:hypothetical protein [Deltaproteobacteria bacterium]